MSKSGKANVRKINDQIRSASGGQPKAAAKKSSTAATRKIKGRLESGKSKKQLKFSGGEPGKQSVSGLTRTFKTKQGEKQYDQQPPKSSKTGGLVRNPSSSAPEGNSKPKKKSSFSKFMKDGVAKSRKKKRKAPTYRG